MKPFLFHAAALNLLTALALVAGPSSRAVGPPAIKPRELVRLAVANEIKNDSQNTKYMFQQRKVTPNGSQTRLMVQTRDAMVGMVVANNDQP
jgi:hypothetical protein